MLDLIKPPEITYMQCDAAGCDYITNDIGENPIVEFLTKDCPKCGAPLLTQADVDSFNAMCEMLPQLNELAVSQLTDEERAELEGITEGDYVLYAYMEGDGKGGIHLRSVNSEVLKDGDTEAN